MRLDDFDKNEEPDRKPTGDGPSQNASKKALEEALRALHREFLRVDTLLRNMPDNK